VVYNRKDANELSGSMKRGEFHGILSVLPFYQKGFCSIEFE
jgi:hypothetical protein